MKQVLAFPLALLIAAPGSAHALGLGNIERKSALNQPFSATIDLIGVQADEIDSLKVRLAEPERFQRAGIERSAILSQLRFEVVQTPHGTDYIKITSNEAIREPFLDFLVEVEWMTGRIYREYTVLLDPPNYAGAERLPQPRKNIADRTRAAVTDNVEKVRTRSPSTTTIPPEHHAVATRAVDQYGPVRANEGLWSIAQRVRPERKISVQQMMLALLRANPEAFLDGNINVLKKGAVLRVPSTDELTQTTQAEALTEIKRQLGEWRRGRSAGGTTAPRNKQQNPVPQARAEQPPAAATGDGELKVVTPGQNTQTPVSGTESKGTGAGTAAPEKTPPKDLALAQEALDSQRQENADLKAKLTETDETLKLLQQQIALKNAELAAIQAKFATAPPAAAGNGETPALVAPTSVQPVTSAEPTKTDATTAAVQPATQGGDAKAMAATPVPSVVPAETADSDEGWTGMLESIPGGIFTLAGSLLTLTVGALFWWKRRRSVDEESFADEESELDDVVAHKSVDQAPALVFEQEKTEHVADKPGLDRTLPEEHPEPAAIREQAEEGVFKPKGRSITEVLSFENDTTLGLSGDLREDPLAEVNVYLAYEQFEQAEVLVQEAIRTHPQDHSFKLRLLEVYYSSGNARAYENYARSFRDAVGEGSPLWEDAQAMWREMSPGRALFDSSGNVMPQPSAASANKFVDITELTSDEVSDPVSEVPAEQNDLDFDLSIVDLSSSSEPNEAAEVLDLTSALPRRPAGVEVIDYSDLSLTDVERTGFIDLSAESIQDDALGAFLDISGGSDATEKTQGEGAHVSAAPQTLDFNFDLEATGGESKFLDVTANSVIDPTGHGDVLDLTAADAEIEHRTAKTTQPLHLGEGTNGFEITFSGATDVPLIDTADLAPAKVGNQTKQVDSDFVPSGLSYDQDLVSGDSTLTNMHEVPDIDFSLSTGAVIGKPNSPAANHELTPIDGEQKPFEEITWSFEDSREDEAELHLNAPKESANLELHLEQDPSPSDFLDIFGSNAEPVEALTGTDESLLDADALAPVDEQRQTDDVDAKLSLARTYLELGDLDGASSMLDEVDVEGSSKQKDEASKLRGRMKR